MLDLENFIKLLEDAMPSEDGVFSINEKIMSKKAARRRRLQAKKLAQQKAQQQAELEKEQEQNVENSGEKQEGTAIIEYNPNAGVKNPQTDYSESYKKWIQLLNGIIQKYDPLLKQADDMWRNTGTDKPCPQEAYDLYKQVLDGLSKDLASLTEGEPLKLLQEMSEEEANYIQTSLIALNGYIEKKGQLVQGIHPEEFIGQEQQTGTDLVTTTSTEVTTKTGTSLATTTGTNVIPVDTTPLEDDNKTKNRRQKDAKDLLTYDKWQKSNKKLDGVWEKVKENENELAGMSYGEFVKRNNPLIWFKDGLWGFITSPLAKDIVKTFMYANPFTKMLFDGDFGNFGIKQGIKNIQDGIEQLKKRKEEENKQKRDKSFYNNRGIPKDVSKLKINDLAKEFYGNKIFVNWVNICHIHPEVDIQDKIDLRKYVKNVKNGIKSEERQKTVKDFTSLIEKVNEICNYMDWNEKKDYEELCKKWLNNIQAKKDNQKKIIDKQQQHRKNNKTNKNNTFEKLKQTIRDIKAYDKDATNDKIKQNLLDRGFSEKSIDKAMQEFGESLEERFTRLEKLLEEAEGE